MDTVFIRDANIKDLTTLKHFEQEIIKAERPFDPTIRPTPVNYYDLADYIMRDDVKVVVAQWNDDVVASGYALRKKARPYLDHGEYAYLGFMYTKKEFRGQGINQKVVEVLMNWARDQNLSEVRLTVYDDNLPAIKAYEKVGFKSHIQEMRLRLKDNL